MKHFFRIAVAMALLISVSACGKTPVKDSNDAANEDLENLQQNISVECPDDSSVVDVTDGSSAGADVSEEPSDGSESTVENDDSANTGEDVQTTEPEVSEDTVEDEPVNSVEEESLFDTSWASNDYEKLLPQPPFTGWVGTMKDTNVYEISTSEANADGSGEYYAKFGTYLNSLRKYDFSVEGDEFNAVAYDPNGNEFRFKCGDGWAWITFIPIEIFEDKGAEKPEDSVSVPLFSTDWATTDMEKVIPEPPMIIARSYADGDSWIITNRLKDYRLADEPRFEVTADVTRVQALEYFDQLRTFGFTESSPVYENKTEIEDAIGGFFISPDGRYSVIIWHKDDYNMTISIKAIS